LVIALAIGGVLLTVVTVMLLQFNRLTSVHQESLKLSHQLQQAASVLNRDVVGAAAGQVAATAGGVTLTLDILTIPTFGGSAEPITTTITYLYAEADQTLRRTDAQGSGIISRQISELDLGPSRTITSTLWVTMTVASQAQEQQMTLELHRRVAAAP
jgi:type II secretory pathway component PulJ